VVDARRVAGPETRDPLARVPFPLEPDPRRVAAGAKLERGVRRVA
jgi:hypothetical protein